MRCFSSFHLLIYPLRYQVSLLLSGMLMLGLSVLMSSCHSERIDFNAQIRPILNTHCISCHGGVKQSGGFSLLFEEDALAITESGSPAIIPGSPTKSEFIQRLRHHDPEVRMPYEKDPLSEEDIQLLENWIEQGARWEEHWAYISPVPISPPSDMDLPQEDLSWIRNDIDRFILSRLAQDELHPSEQADCATLARRVSLDLTGLPPSLERVDRFCQDASEEAYAELVKELMASPAYGERWAALWMDLARYADTKGYERDPHRDIWRYRDWLIQAFNTNMPFDQFTREQLAGDLLDQPSPKQYVATAFHRNTMNNDEGGTDNEYYRATAVIDRVNTTWEVWMGTSFGCVQCHSHPYDPFRQEEYYQFYDIFNQSADADIFAESPRFKFYTQEDSGKAEAVLNWVKQQSKDKKNTAEITRHYHDFLYITEPKIHPHFCDSLTNGALADAKFLLLRANGFTRFPALDLSAYNQILVSVRSGQAGGTLRFTLDALEGLELGKVLIQEKGGYERFFFPKDLPGGQHNIFVQYFPPATQPDASVMLNWFVPFGGLPGKNQEGFAQISQTLIEVLNARSETVPIMYEHQGEFRRTTHVFERGSFTQPGKVVQAGLPASLTSDKDIAQANRLALAQWISGPDNPLTARVMANRFWEQLFGRGIVETLEDFGTQGLPPSHPELLDWLALRFRDHYHWDIQGFLTEIVLSASYRQSSMVSKELAAADPQNRLLGRGARVRLSAEQIRDQALAVSGLLSQKMYGKSVMPPQPNGVWKVIYNGAKWMESKGEDRYRRALYTYWRRTSPYPSFLSFDSPTREVCTSRRISTNTPLQALVTLNDPVYMEAALSLAYQAYQEKGFSDESLSHMYHRAIHHPPSASTLQRLKNILSQADQHYSSNQKAREELLSHAAFPLECIQDTCSQLAALTIVANTIMNLDVFITKE
ncbi:MAG: PSD1 and planctomycete cytochrome C domain-containing protein [Bacteroidota bacterium]